MIITISIITVILFYIILINAFLKKNHTTKNTSKFNTFSVIIAAKNEEKKLPRLLESLKNLEYPSDKYEIIFVDDNSNDKTYEIIEEFKNNFQNVSLIKSGNKEIPGKKGALQVAVRQAKFDFIVTTDADSRVPKYWLQKINENIHSPNTIIVGNVLFTSANSFIGRFATYELLRNNFLTVALTKLNMPYTAIGANFCYPKDLLKKIGGFAAISQVLSGDDDLLLQKGLKLGYNIDFLEDEDGTVFVIPPANFKEHFRRKVRHVSTSNYYSFEIKVILALWHILNLAAFFSVILIPFVSSAIYFFVAKIILDYISIHYLLKRYGIFLPYMEILIHLTIYEIMIPVNYLCATFCKIKWKE